MMTGREMRKKLHKGEKVYGTMSTAVSPEWPGLVKESGLDFLIIETEHHPRGREHASWMCRGCLGAGLVPVVRVPKPDPYLACMARDGGAEGVIAPYVETPQQVRELVGAVKYRPLKGERLRNVLEGREQLEPGLKAYLDERNADGLAIVNIESLAAIRALDDILAVEGLDAVLIGPHDLSCSMGIPEKFSDPRFVEAAAGIIRKARARGIGAGIHVYDSDFIKMEPEWVKAGANLIVHLTDGRAWRSALCSEVAALKRELER